jgi:hypothetical protein
VIVPLVTDSLEWTLSSPPPLHQFDEPPCLVEVDHLVNLKPGLSVEDALKAQGETVTEVEGLDKWAMEDYTPEKFEAWVKEQDAKWEEANAKLNPGSV